MKNPSWRTNILGASCAFGAAMGFSVLELMVKFLSDSYALHQTVFFRAIVGMTAFAICVMPFQGGLRVFHTKRLNVHIFRGFCVVAANTCLFLGLASLPLADAVAIYFVAPLVTALMSVIFLRETVGPRRWTAILIGLFGVMLIVKPGTSAFQLASLFPMLAATLYSTMHITARRVSDTESAFTMTAYSNLTFLIVGALVGLCIGWGQFQGMGPEELDFLLRPWATFNPADTIYFILLGTCGLAAVLLITQAYRIAEASFAAPFEYVSIPLAIVWGALFFSTWPDAWSWGGMALILGSGLYLLWREAQIGRDSTGPRGVEDAG
ncbi:MAG: DMT family transporter [Pseudomonadota bacterium]